MSHKPAKAPRPLTEEELGTLVETLCGQLVPDDLETVSGTIETALADICQCGHAMRRHRFGPCTGMADGRRHKDGVHACQCQWFRVFDYRRPWSEK